MHLNWIGIVPAAILGFLVGGLWYGPLFGKAWAAARGITPEMTKGANMPMIFGLTFLLNLVSATVLDHVLATYSGGANMAMTLMISGGIALGFIIPSMGVNYLFSRLSGRLFLIDAGYWLVIYPLMGLVLVSLG